jgi:hypothetical protein
LTQQVKYLAECVERLIQRPANNELYGVPGPSRVGSQEEPIIVSDDDIIIKTEKIEDSEVSGIKIHLSYKYNRYK